MLSTRPALLGCDARRIHSDSMSILVRAVLAAVTAIAAARTARRATAAARTANTATITATATLATFAFGATTTSNEAPSYGGRSDPMVYSTGHTFLWHLF